MYKAIGLFSEDDTHDTGGTWNDNPGNSTGIDVTVHNTPAQNNNMMYLALAGIVILILATQSKK